MCSRKVDHRAIECKGSFEFCSTQGRSINNILQLVQKKEEINPLKGRKNADFLSVRVAAALFLVGSEAKNTKGCWNYCKLMSYGFCLKENGKEM